MNKTQIKVEFPNGNNLITYVLIGMILVSWCTY